MVPNVSVCICVDVPFVLATTLIALDRAFSDCINISLITILCSRCLSKSWGTNSHARKPKGQEADAAHILIHNIYEVHPQ
jgi:hypothetical protein